MMFKAKNLLAVAGLLLGFTGTASAVVVDFTGGTVYFENGGTAVTTPGNELYSNNGSDVDYYVEGGFKLDFINAGGASWDNIGDYYGVDETGAYNDVIHSHWNAPPGGGLGDTTAIEITQVGGGTFDLNYFILTSNTETGGGAASGNELAYIEAWVGGVMTHRQLLPSDDWGWAGPDPQIILGSMFDAVDLVRFTVDNSVDCFGMDEFYINEPPPVGGVPEPGVFALFGLGLIGLRLAKRIV